MKRSIIPAVAICLIGLGLTGCAASSADTAKTPRSAQFTSGAASSAANQAAVDGPSYGSVEKLTATSDLVVEGQFIKPIEDVDDGTLNGGQASGLPITVWEFHVANVSQGDATLEGKTIHVAQFNFAKVASSDLSNVASPDANAYLFLRGYSDGETYAVVGTGQGAILVTNEGDLLAAPNADTSLTGQIDDLDTTSDLDEVIANS